jgi:hypothetical protein
MRAIWAFFNAGYNVALYLDKHGYLVDVRYAAEGIGPFVAPTILDTTVVGATEDGADVYRESTSGSFGISRVDDDHDFQFEDEQF